MKGYFPVKATIPELWSGIVKKVKASPLEGGPILHMHLTGTSIWSEFSSGNTIILVAMDVGDGIVMMLDTGGDTEYRIGNAEFDQRIRPRILATLP